MKPRKLRKNRNGSYTLPLTQGEVAIIDAEDAQAVGQHNWQVLRVKTTTGKELRYASWAIKPGKKQLLQDFLLGPKFKLVSFVDGDSLNCRRANLNTKKRD